MQEFKGTPGPWFVDWSFFTVVNKDSKNVADFDYGRFEQDEDCMNALLIAAAPELLEALRDLEARACIYVNTSKAKTAIAKALGNG